MYSRLVLELHSAQAAHGDANNHCYSDHDHNNHCSDKAGIAIWIASC